MESATFKQLSRDLAAAIDTGNRDEVVTIHKQAYESMMDGDITVTEMAELVVDIEVAGYDV